MFSTTYQWAIGSSLLCCCKNEGVPDSALKSEEMYLDRAIMRDLSGCSVQCLNDGCEWNGPFKGYQQHVEACSFELIQCLHKEGCGALIKRKDLSAHLERECPMRMVTCQHCKEEYPWKILRQHFDECEEISSECQFCRNIALPRKQLKVHQHPETGNCPNRPEACKFKAVGCTLLIPSDDKGRHGKEYIEKHQEMLCESVVSMQPVIEQAKRDQLTIDATKELMTKHDIELTNLQTALHSLQDEFRKVQVNNSDLKSKTNHQEFESEFKMHKSRLSETENKISVLETQMSTYEGITAVLNGQLERDTQQLQTFERQRRQDRELLDSLERKIKAQDRIIALKDVALAEQDLRIQSLEMTSYDGILVWKISDFTRKLNEARSGRATSIYSPCFFPSRHGYKMCVRIYLNGDGMGKGNHVSLFFVIMKGPFDALLRWPFRQKVTFMWLDQNNREHVIDAFRPDPTSSSFQRPKNDMNIASGCPLFMPLSQIDSPRHAYVKDDVAFLKIIVDTSDLG
ncbi:TNF receptor-associated factor 2-like [Ptychodera flava]|uniref:TNF receptor-associated factor 2-like n=1 Tax=Ptychodera flava TaxID=63121 RepID=UPI00396A7DC1